jgi:hypothetical protein
VSLILGQEGILVNMGFAISMGEILRAIVDDSICEQFGSWLGYSYASGLAQFFDRIGFDVC